MSSFLSGDGALIFSALIFSHCRRKRAPRSGEGLIILMHIWLWLKNMYQNGALENGTKD